MSNLASNHLSTNGSASNYHKTPLTALSPHSTLNSSLQQRDVTSIAYFIAGYALHHKSLRHSERTIVFHTDRLTRFAWFLQSEGYPLTLSEITPLQSLDIATPPRTAQVVTHAVRSTQAADYSFG